MLLALAACQASDQQIQADIAGKAQQDLNFAGLHYTVKGGVVTFTGHCPSQKALAKIKQTIKNIHVIKAVNYQVTIAPVVLNLLTPIKLQVDSLVAQYPQVTADVDSAGVTLKGALNPSQKLKFMKAFNSLNISAVRDSLTLR